MRSLIVPILACAGALALAGCNSSAPPPQAAMPQARAGLTPAALPQGAGCTNEIARYRAVIDNDHSTGNVGDNVWKQIEGEIASASAACAAGKDGEALALLRASKSRHGYPG
ncbi:MAG: hypothetical protein U1E28_11810 [Beijerinckiaceae bacterium]